MLQEVHLSFQIKIEKRRRQLLTWIIHLEGSVLVYDDQDRIVTSNTQPYNHTKMKQVTVIY